jgi:hypothetical protein
MSFATGKRIQYLPCYVKMFVFKQEAPAENLLDERMLLQVKADRGLITIRHSSQLTAEIKVDTPLTTHASLFKEVTERSLAGARRP